MVPVPYDLRIGVTGHRNLTVDKQPAIEAAVRAVLERIEQVLVEASARSQSNSSLVAPASWHGHLRELNEAIDTALTAVLRKILPAMPANPRDVPLERRTPFRWVVVSPLAKGADRIVAREILSRGPCPLDSERAL